MVEDVALAVNHMGLRLRGTQPPRIQRAASVRRAGRQLAQFNLALQPLVLFVDPIGNKQRGVREGAS